MSMWLVTDKKPYENSPNVSCHLMDYSDPSSLTTTCATSCALSYSIAVTPPSQNQQRISPYKKYKGVVPQPNGRWGVQLYNGRKRVWIGTFDTREHAAHAYDIAVLRFRGPHNITNFPVCHYGRPHTEFLASISESRVIDMLRNHTYQDELARFKRARMGSDPGSARELLFKKVMTPSDVGRLHRLVIPKHHAESYFPKIDKNNENDNNMGGKMLSFEDGSEDKMWKFKYCYWKSSQNYVLTKGWGEFVKDKGLNPGDTVYFCSNSVGSTTSDKQFFIDTSCKVAEDDNNSGTTTSRNNDEVASLSRFKALRLFGVDISACDACVECHGKCESCSQIDRSEVFRSKR